MEADDPRFAEYERRGLTWERAMAHARILAQKAADKVARDPGWHPVGLIFTPDASEIQASVPNLIASGQAQPDDWVPLLVSREQALAMLRANAPQTQEWLAADRRDGQRLLPVVVVAPFGMRLGHEPLPPVANRPQATGRVPCTVHAMLLCHQAVQQADSGKWCVLGTYDQLRVSRLPALHQMAVFVCLGDFVSGNRIQLVLRVGDQELCRIEAEAGIGEPMGTLDLGVPFPTMEFQRAGTYQLDLMAGGRLLASRHLQVMEHKP
jgi:hypothetical protein